MSRRKTEDCESRQKLWAIILPQVVAFVPTGWMYEFKKDRSGFPVRSKGNCEV